MSRRSDLAFDVVAGRILLIFIERFTTILAFPLTGGRNLLCYGFNHVLNASHIL